MTVVNGKSLLELSPIVNMIDRKERSHGVSFGLSECGYDVRIKQDIRFSADEDAMSVYKWGTIFDKETWRFESYGRFTLASTVERFTMPDCLVGVVHDKSTWARRGLSVFNTVIESGWSGWLTLELVYHGNDELIIPAGSGIAQVLFSRIENPASYAGGKYDNQEDCPVEARFV